MSEPTKDTTKPETANTHTFVVTTVVTEPEVLTAEVSKEIALKAVPVDMPKKSVEHAETQTSTTTSTCLEQATSSAVVPLSSSLPSKLLRLHAKRSAQALLQQISCEEEAAASSSPVCVEEKLIDVGMGSSIEDSEESMEEIDELKPLAVDNHVLYDIDFDTAHNSNNNNNNNNSTACVSTASEPISTPAVLSEANLEKFHKHHTAESSNATQYANMENIYLHPNFKYQIQQQQHRELEFESSPPPAVAPANSPTPQPRVHRSFLTLKKPVAVSEQLLEKPCSVVSQADTNASTEACGVNEIDALDATLIPSEEICAEIAEAVEFYFSNDVILKDAFLLKHVRRNKEGFVSLKLVSSFKRVRQLTKDWRVVGYAVRLKSRKIELNDIGTKVRRLEPLPNFDETMPSRTIVACDLPLEKLTIEKVSDIFSKCGEIALIRILKPGMNIPVDVRQFMNKYPEMQQKECALVEYVESSAAREAKYLKGQFQVYDMVAPKKKTGKKAVVQMTAPVARMVENYRYYNDATYERSRGGSFSGVMPPNEDLRYKLKRNNSDFPTKALHEMQQYQGQPPNYHHHYQNYAHQHSPTHRGSFGSGEYNIPQYQHYAPRANHHAEPVEPTHNANANANVNANNNYYGYAPGRRYSNASTAPAADNNNVNMSVTGSSNLARRLSNCSDNYSAYSEMSRRASNCSDHMPQRRDSNCSENCPCSKRLGDFGSHEVYRKTSQGSIGSGSLAERRFSNGSLQFERQFSSSDINQNSGGYTRRLSNDFNYERKPSLEPNQPQGTDDSCVGGGGGGYIVFPRRHSNNFNNVANKLAQYDNAQYINGRRISTDSGYDRRFSFGSEYEGSPRSRTSSFLNNYKHGLDQDGQPRSRTSSFLDNSPRSRSGSWAQRNAENLVRTPMGPDGSKGFCSRARKIGQTISPVN